MFSLWGDAAMTTCEFYTAAPYIPFKVFLMLEPGPDGAFAAEYMLILPSNLIVQVTTPSPVISIVMDNPIGPPGVSVGFSTCQTEIFVLYQFLILPLATTPGYVQIVPNTDTDRLIVATCEEPLRPEKDCAVYNYFCFNTSSGAVEETSWGTIKSLYDSNNK
jgi:hypothetical protein